MTIPRVIAHRGSSAAHADNSWAAFEAAVEEGADAIECDVVATSDGALMIRHDLSIAGRSVRELSAAELAHLDDELIRLDELLPWAANAPIDLLVEIKEPDVALVVATMVAESTWCEHVTIGGFHGPALAAIKTLVPRIRTSFMMGSVAGGGELVALARACRADGIHLCWDGRATHPHRLLDDALHVCLRGAGLDITLWHEEREGELQALVAWQPDAICTDTPARLRRIVNAHCAMGSKLNT